MKSEQEIYDAARLAMRLFCHERASDPDIEKLPTKVSSSIAAAFCWILDCNDFGLVHGMDGILKHAKDLPPGPQETGALLRN